MTKKYSRQQCRKKSAKKCFFCGIDDYELLHAHRLLAGEHGGRYDWINTLVCCVLCHRKIHIEKIKILGWHPSTSGKWILNYIDENGLEKWEPY